LAGVLVLAAACGTENTGDGGDHGGDDGVDLLLDLFPSSATIPIGGSATLIVSIVRLGFEGDLTLTARLVPDNLIVAYEPSTIRSNETSRSQLSVTVLEGTTPGTVSFEVAANAGSVTYVRTLSVTTTSATTAY
jgi:hypothetical protein